ncbi:MAG: carboxypeptidase regulatory-like domain-containing protein [Bryobacteraceae bacterium]|nr:carboxypeptidase regulatory-like domain-containing protein [Bryobacteraceae bacterium]
MAQQITGTLTGIVSDPSGASIPGAAVTMTNENSGDIRRSETNEEGYFSITGVMPGTYTVRIEHSGFNTYQAEKVPFTAGDRRTLGRITLDVARAAEEVTVTAVVSELTPIESGEKSVVLTAKQFNDVAVVGRSAAEYVKILPGMATISSNIENRPGFNGETIGINGNGDAGKQSMIGNVSANGTRAAALDITADGAHVSDPGCNCATPVNPNPEMIAEFKVQQSNFSAEYAKGPVVLNSITKAGGRDFHGAGYLYARHHALNSNDWLLNRNGVQEPENKYYFPGFNIGGPVVLPGTNFNRNRDKLFFFAGYEYFRQTIDTGLLRAIVPTDAMRAGNFSDSAYRNALGRATQNVSGSIADMFPNNIIPSSQVDPGMAALLKLVPQPNSDPNALDGYNWANALVVDQNMHQFITRADYSISDYTKLFVRYNLQRELQKFPIQLWWRNAGAVPLPTPIDGKNASDSISFNFTKVINPTMTNETVFGYTFVDFPNAYNDYDQMTKSSVGYPYQGIFRQDDKIPGFLSWGGPTAGMWLAGGFDPVLFATKHLVTMTNNTTKVIGTHTVKLGGYWGYIINKQPGNEPSAGLITFGNWTDRTSGNILADMVAGIGEGYTENTLAIVRDMGWHEFAFFAQDSWKLNPRFTLEYGLRAQHMQPWTARNGIGIATWVENQYRADAPSADLPGINWHARDPNVPLSGWATRALFWAPRVGGAYDLFGNGSTVLRGGFGTFIYHDPQMAAGAMDLPAGLRNTNVSGGFLLSEIDRVSTQGSLVFGGEAVDGADDSQPTTYTWSATVSQRLPSRTLVELSYVGNKSTNLNLAGNLRDVNLVPVGAMLNDPGGDTNAYRPRPQYRALQINSHQAYSNYNSLQTTVTKQTGLVNLTVAYTWSKAMGIVDNPIDWLRIGNNYGPLGFDRTHVFASSWVLNVPDVARGGNAFARQVLNGWQLSGIVQWQSGINLQQAQGEGGRNFNMRAEIPGSSRTIGGPDITGTNAVAAMPIILCDPRSGLSSGQYVNASCFAPPIAGVNGQPGTNGAMIMPYMSGPAFFNTDLSIFKRFRVSESKSLQFRASAYNFPNHPVRSFISGDPNLRLEFDETGRIENSRFGYADSKVGRRIIQLGLKFEF